MQIAQLKRKVTKSFAITGILLTILGGEVFFSYYQKSSLQKTIDQISGETSEIKNKASDLSSKTLELKKYVSMWSSIDEKKKNVNGIKMDEVNSTLNEIANKYSILSPQIKVNLPEQLQGGLFDRSTINILLTSVVLNFKAASDIKALSFVTDFLNSLNGYKVVTNLEIKKDKDYSLQDLIEVSSGKNGGNISGKLEFFWYINKNKDSSKALVEALSKDSKNNGDNPSQNIPSKKVQDEKQPSL